VKTLRAYFEGRGMNLATASVAWVLSRPGVTSAIVGASRPDQLDATLAAADLTLDDEAAAACESVWWTLPRRAEGR
jgi:aryl-alcohol dehydrogenase-like predicted oxidoreductase